ncbi:type II toxin-antitoxin system VapB family antitoxin [Endothiovibrio diazotrophicus]
MGLSIKNPEAERLARAVAAESGESITRAIIHALEAELIRLRGRKRQPDVYEAIMEISERCGALPDLDERSADEILGYDEHGVPG